MPLGVLRKEPALFGGAAVVLALGVGANGAIFSLAHAVLLEPLPFERAHEVVLLRTSTVMDGAVTPRDGATRSFIETWRERAPGLLTDIAAVKLWRAGANPYDLVFPDRAERLRAGEVTPNFFSILGAQPHIGRLFTEQDDPQDLAVLGYVFWQQAFGGDPEVVGRTVLMTSGRGKDRRPRMYTIVGVLPADFRFTYPLETQLWALHSWASLADAHPDSIEYWGAVGRLAEGVSEAAAESVFADAIESRSRREDRTYHYSTDVRTIREWMVGETRPAVVLLAAVSLLLLLIACVAVAGTLLVRLDARRGELALRSALGAGRARLTRQLLTEGLMLATLGTALGTLLVFGMIPLLRSLVPSIVPRGDQISVDSRVLLAAGAVATVATLAAALAPVLQAARAAAAPALKRGSGQTAAPGGTRLRSGLLAAQAALATALLIGAALLLTSFWRLHQVDLGFEGDQVVTAEMRLLETRYYADPEVMPKFQDDVLKRVRAIPGVLEAGMTSAVPFRGTDWTVRYGENPGDVGHIANRREVDPGYFSVMGLRLAVGDSLRTGIRPRANRWRSSRSPPRSTSSAGRMFWANSFRSKALPGSSAWCGMCATAASTEKRCPRSTCRERSGLPSSCALSCAWPAAQTLLNRFAKRFTPSIRRSR